MPATTVFESVNKENIGTSKFHHIKTNVDSSKVYENVLGCIGNTPLIKLNKINLKYGIECNLYVKCEYFNACGSIKDRVALRLIEEAEREGKLKPGSVLIEPTSGNTGIGIALISLIKGYRTIITLPSKMSLEKVNLLKVLGAEIIRTPDDAPLSSPESYIGVAKKLRDEIPGAIILDQYCNPYNPITHYDTTAEEILKALDGKIDMFVAGAGTGGTVTGISAKLKERCKDIKIVAVDPIGSNIAPNSSLSPPSDHPNSNGNSTPPKKFIYQVEGIGHSIVPRVLDRSLIDIWCKVTDKISFDFARQLIREEGLLCGGSSGSAVYAAIQHAKSLKKGQNCVIILPDSVRNYMTKFLNDEWMQEKGYLDEDVKSKDIHLHQRNGNDVYNGKTVRNLELHAVKMINPKTTCSELLQILESQSLNHVYISHPNNSNQILGSITVNNLLLEFKSNQIQKDTPIETIMKKFELKGENFVTVNTGLHQVETLLESFECLYVLNDNLNEVKGKISKLDLVKSLIL